METNDKKNREIKSDLIDVDNTKEEPRNEENIEKRLFL